MPHTTASIHIDYYTDVLCVWAWIAQPRLEELNRQWAGRVTIRPRSSLQAHLFLKAVALVTDEALVEPVALRIRQAFLTVF